MTSPTTGHIEIGSGKHSNTRLVARTLLLVPAEHITMISFPAFLLFLKNHPFGLELYKNEQDGSETMMWRETDHSFLSSYVLDAENITVQWMNTYTPCQGSSCFKMVFSFHPKSVAPRVLDSGLFNCSVDNYSRFQHHLHCNMKLECEDGRDETEHCPFSSPACKGWVSLGHKCFRFISKETLRDFDSSEKNSYMKAVKYCESLNASVGMPKFERRSPERFPAFVDKITREIKFSYVAVSLFFGDMSLPSMYIHSLIAGDNTVIHHDRADTHGPDTIPDIKFRGEKECLYFDRGYLDQHPCSSSWFIENELNSICEFTTSDDGGNHKGSESIEFHNTTFVFESRTDLTSCPNGQITHWFLSCGAHDVCAREHVPPCVFSNTLASYDSNDPSGEQYATTVAMFTCADGVTQVSYTLVCDFRQDCQDQSDESFCEHLPCHLSFTCTNGQCVPYNNRCDQVPHCLDASDEKKCDGYQRYAWTRVDRVASPVLINFDSKKSFTVKRMMSNESCPDTHYRCPGEYNDCLPVYTRCNGLYDCIGHGDEEGCEEMTCPGFYRCFTSTVCVHADHLCDGWPHCPQRDDEWLCDMICPAGCLCQGHTFLCPQSFSAHLFPQLRYLDAQGSGMTLSDLEKNPYLVHLSLSNCSLTILADLKLLNVQFLDLSNNNLRSVNVNVFTGLVNLHELSLVNNPLYLVHSDTGSVVKQIALRIIDLSHTKLSVFDSSVFSSFLNVQIFNLSFTTIHTVHANGFQYTTHVSDLHMEGTPLKTFPADLLKSLSHLRVVSAGNYKLCCREILPDHFDEIMCDAPKDDISSCADLLQSAAYRGCLWLISFLSMFGNVFCLVVRVCVQRTVSTSGFHVFVTHLSMSDFLMGVYIAMIGVADEVFRGKYLHYDDTWTHSAACKVAGFLALLSCEVSALTICLITVDRFIALHFPFSSWRFEKTSATVVCLVVWLLGWLLALLPLLPVTSHWEFYSQTGICIPLPVTRHDFKGRIYSISVLIVFNFVLFLLIAIGQAFIYRSIQKNALTAGTTRVSRDMTIALRLISVAVTDFLCWFPIGLCGLLALAGIQIPGEANVALAIFVLPLNSALNPFMYTFNMLMEKQRKSNEAKLFKWLESQTDLLGN